MNETIGWLIYLAACAVFSAMAFAKTDDESCGPEKENPGPVKSGSGNARHKARLESYHGKRPAELIEADDLQVDIKPRLWFLERGTATLSAKDEACIRRATGGGL